MTLTDAEKTRLLAEGVMGWKAVDVMDVCGGCRFGFRSSVSNELTWSALWEPLHNEAHAAEVRERMRELGWHWEMETDDKYDWFRLRNKLSGVRHDVMVPCGAIPRGTCDCALLALGLAKEEGS